MKFLEENGEKVKFFKNKKVDANESLISWQPDDGAQPLSIIIKQNNWILCKE